MLRETERRMSSLTSSNGRPTNCAMSKLASLHRTCSEPAERTRMVSPVVGSWNSVVKSNDTSTGAVSTKYAAVGCIGFGER